jgi:2-polyprenyl-6-methoxyphenol hydroxylase-like FAD-dependent oxidoreductase
MVFSGPTGLATAIMLARLGWRNITVYDRLPEPPPPDSPSWSAGGRVDDDAGRAAAAAGGDGRSYNIGLGGRGQLALTELGCMERVAARCADVTASMRWEPGSTAFSTVARGSQPLVERKKSWTSRIIRRDRLAACLLAELRERYGAAAAVVFGAECAGVEFGPSAADPAGLTLRHADGREERVVADLVVGTDGVNSAVCVRACLHACVCACVRACVRAYICACVRVGGPAVRVCVCVCVGILVLHPALFPSFRKMCALHGLSR